MRPHFLYDVFIYELFCLKQIRQTKKVELVI